MQIINLEKIMHLFILYLEVPKKHYNNIFKWLLLTKASSYVGDIL